MDFGSNEFKFCFTCSKLVKEDSELVFCLLCVFCTDCADKPSAERCTCLALDDDIEKGDRLERLQMKIGEGKK